MSTASTRYATRSKLAVLTLYLLAGCAGGSGGVIGEPAIRDPADRQIDERVQRRIECDTLIDRINAELGRIKERTEAARRAGPSRHDILEISHLYEELGDIIADLELTDAELSLLADHYQLMARRVSRAARKIAEAAATEDIAALDRAQASFDQLMVDEGQLAQEINDFCDGAEQDQPPWAGTRGRELLVWRSVRPKIAQWSGSSTRGQVKSRP